MRYTQKSSEVIRELNSSIEEGLNDAQILTSREKYGYNELA